MTSDLEQRVLVLVSGRDAALTCAVLAEAEISCKQVTSVEQFAHELRLGAGAVLIAEEAITDRTSAALKEILVQQPPWSDLPVIVVTKEGACHNRLGAYSALGNVSVLTRPMALDAITSTVGSALRARRRQYEVRELIAERETQARRKDEFLAMLAHELRNPLAPVRTTLHVLKLRHPHDRNTQSGIAVAERSIKHLAHLIDDLLDVSRVTLGKVQLAREPVDIAGAVTFAIESLSARAREKEMSVSLEKPQEAVHVFGDSVRLEQVVANLVDNAIKYTHFGGSVDVTLAVADHQAIITVSDSGAGIAAADLPHVFDLFAQADRSLDRTAGGLGVGLTIVKEIVELHGGQVSLHSPGPNAGTTAEVRLPLAPEDISRRPSPEPSRSVSEKLRVLVVDDNRDGAESLADFLSLTGCDTKTAYDGTEAIQMFREFRPEAVLLDIGLPGLTGYEVAERIRTSPEGKGVTIVAVSGYGREEDRALGRRAGFDHHLVKPVDLGVIGRLLTSAVRAAHPA